MNECIKRHLPVCYLLCILTLLAPHDAQAAQNPLASARQNYNKLVERNLADQIAARNRLLKSYSDTLNQALAKNQKAGNLDALLALRAEKKRFAASKTLPPMDTETSPILLPLIQNFHKSLADVKQKTSQRTLQSAERYTEHLNKMKTVLTQKGDIDNALAARAEIARVNSSSLVTEAQAALNTPEPKKEPTADKPSRTPRNPIAAAPKGSPCGNCVGTGKDHKDCSKCSATGKCYID